MSRNVAELVGQDGILRPIGKRPLEAFASSQAGRLAIGRRIPSCPTLAHADYRPTQKCRVTSGGMRLASIATVAMAVWSAAAEAPPANRWMEVRRDAVGARRGSAIRYVPGADA